MLAGECAGLLFLRELAKEPSASKVDEPGVPSVPDDPRGDSDGEG